MTIQQVLFVILVFTTFYNNGIQFYIHQEAYPLLSLVGKAEFPAYLKAYEERLTLALLVPYGVTLLSNIALLLVGSGAISAKWLIVAFVLNLAVSIVTTFVATPVYNRVKQAGQAGGDDMAQLMRINLLRLGLTTLSSLVMVYLLYRAAKV
jgi:hypothetical protein